MRLLLSSLQPLLLTALVILADVQADEVQETDAQRNTEQLIQSRGFKSEAHDVETDDGYIIRIFRIKHPLLTPTGRAVLLQHPLVGESANWLINSADGSFNDNTSVVGNNLGFELAKRGFDVWLGNVRGNTYGERHRTLSKSDPRFWQFSMDEHSALDLPAMISHILKTTDQSQLDYVGHSQGSMIMFALLSRRPEYANVIGHFIALGPVAYLGHVATPLKYLLNSIPFRFYLNWSPGEFLPPSSILQPISHFLCPSRWTGPICKNFLFLVCGYDQNQIDRSRIPVIVAHAPAGTSKQNMLHFLQMVGSKHFRMFDRGTRGNMASYGSAQPPDYDVSRITHQNISLIWGDNDALADPADVQLLRERLTVKLADDYKVPVKYWNHLDFLWARDTGKYVNTKVLEILNRG